MGRGRRKVPGRGVVISGLVGVLVLLLGVSCVENTPRATAQAYLEALGRLDFAGAAQFVTDEGKPNFETLRRIYNGLNPSEQKKFQTTDWAVTGETTTGDLATVDFTFDGTRKGQLALKRVGGVWRVDHRRTF